MSVIRDGLEYKVVRTIFLKSVEVALFSSRSRIYAAKSEKAGNKLGNEVVVKVQRREKVLMVHSCSQHVLVFFSCPWYVVFIGTFYRLFGLPEVKNANILTMNEPVIHIFPFY